MIDEPRIVTQARGVDIPIAIEMKDKRTPAFRRIVVVPNIQFRRRNALPHVFDYTRPFRDPCYGVNTNAMNAGSSHFQ